MRLAPPVVLAVAVAIAAAAAPARADDAPPGPPGARPASGSIALLLVPDPKLAIYGQPVASELAGALERAGLSVVVVTSTSPVPSKARLVIDARIVRAAGDAVVLEARVRDPATSAVVGERTATAPTLTRIDEAVRALATELAAVLQSGLARQAEARRVRADAPDRAPTTAAPGAPASREPAARDARPLALVSIRSAVTPGPDDPALDPLLHAGAVRLADLVGHRADWLRPSDGEPAAALTARGAAVVVHVELLGIRYEDRGVITARARARVVVTDRTGPVFDRVVRTDTLVGGRGDRRDAVARAAIEQIVDVAMPRVRDRLAAAEAAP